VTDMSISGVAFMRLNSLVRLLCFLACSRRVHGGETCGKKDQENHHIGGADEFRPQRQLPPRSATMMTLTRGRDWWKPSSNAIAAVNARPCGRRAGKRHCRV